MVKKQHVFPCVLFLYIVSCFLLFLYSYTQIDLNLTLSRVSVWQHIQTAFQYVGYFNRPFSAACYIGILSVFFLLYIYSVSSVKKNVFTRYQLWILIFCIAILLVLSYPAFSYDLFNYMFTAKTVVLYHQNPYVVIPLHFTGVDPWILFMRWTHLPSAYTPFWILLTLPSYLFGFGYFLPVLWNIKFITMICYVITTIFIGKILRQVDSKNELVGMAVFALNPLVIFETLVSGHNDITMMMFAVISYYLFLQKRAYMSLFILSVSVAAKLMTIFLLPLYVFRWNRLIALICICFGFILVLSERDVLPWYFVWIMPFVALIPRSKFVFIMATGVSLGLLMRYIPFLYLGNWNPPVPLWENVFTIGAIAISMAILLRGHLRRNASVFS